MSSARVGARASTQSRVPIKTQNVHTRTHAYIPNCHNIGRDWDHAIHQKIDNAYTSYKQLQRDHVVLYKPKRKKQFTLARIMAASVNAKTHNRHHHRYQQWLDWLDLFESMGNDVPTLKQLKSNQNMVDWINIVGEYMSDVFDDTHNVGKTVIANLDSLLYCWQLKGLYLQRSSFPWVRRVVRGCNLIAQNQFDRKVDMPKFAIVNPQLELMLKTVNDKHVRMAMLLQHRFIMRAEHIVYTADDKLWLKLHNIRFKPNMMHPKLLMISNNKDKNHQINMPMQRTCKCTCALKWACVVCELRAYLLTDLNKFNDPNAPVIGTATQVLKYRRYLDVVHAVCKQLGWVASNYGTHSFRAGGATELHCEGRDPISIQHFGHWKSMSSVLGYVRPFNSDMHQFISVWDEYCTMCRRQVGAVASNNVVVVTKYVRS